MGKKSFYKNRFRSFVKNNRIVLAALAGAAAGLVITSVLGSDRAKEMLSTAGESIRALGHKAMAGTREAMAKAS